MSLSTEQTELLVKKYQQHDSDTGSPEVQVALLTQRITDLTAHLKKNHKDYQCERGLLRMVSQRRHLLSYLKKHDVTRYRTLISSLGLSK